MFLTFQKDCSVNIPLFSPYSFPALDVTLLRGSDLTQLKEVLCAKLHWLHMALQWVFDQG